MIYTTPSGGSTLTYIFENLFKPKIQMAKSKNIFVSRRMRTWITISILAPNYTLSKIQYLTEKRQLKSYLKHNLFYF